MLLQWGHVAAHLVQRGKRARRPPAARPSINSQSPTRYAGSVISVERAGQEGQLVPHHWGARLGGRAGAVAGHRAAMAVAQSFHHRPRALPCPRLVPGLLELVVPTVSLYLFLIGTCGSRFYARAGRRAAIAGQHGGARRAGKGVRHCTDA
jgi:hypothetical protein